MALERYIGVKALEPFINKDLVLERLVTGSYIIFLKNEEANMPYVKLFYSLVFVLALSACALVPKNFDQSLALGYATQSTVLQTGTTLLQRKQISTKDAKTVLKLSDKAGDLIDEARDLRLSDVSTAEAKLDLATKILDYLQEYLAKLEAN